jgi:hypothetical protein
MGPRRATSVLAWSLFALWAAIAIATAWVGNGQPDNGDSTFPLIAFGYAVVGTLVASRHPRNAVGWLLLVIALTVAVELGAETYAISRSSGFVAAAWMSEWLFHVWFYLTVAFLPLVFPTGRVLSPRWKVVWWFDLVCLVGGVVVVGLTPGELDFTGSTENPLGVQGAAHTVVETISKLAIPTYVLAVVLTGAALVTRFRRSTGAERQQLKWFTSAVLLALSGLVLSAFGDKAPAQILNSIGWTIFLFSCVLGIPIATGIAILRYRLYDIDVVINRTLVYGSLTAALVATYVVSILLLRVVLSPLTGQSDLAVAGSTLVVAAVFRPARARIQQWVDRRFYRRRYDAVHTLEDFSARLRHELDLDAVGADLCTTADQTMQPAHVSLWLRQAR